MLRQTTARCLFSLGFCLCDTRTSMPVATVIIGVIGIRHIVTIMYISQLDNFAGCYLQSGFAPLLSQRWRSMIIAPDTKTLEWSSGFLCFTMAVEEKKRFRCHSVMPNKHSTGCWWWLWRRSQCKDNITVISIRTTCGREGGGTSACLTAASSSLSLRVFREIQLKTADITITL